MMKLYVQYLHGTATNIPLLYIGAKIKFVDVDPLTLNIDINHLKKIVTKKN